MTIEQICRKKKQYLDLLLLADEQESMVDRYLERGEMYALYDPEVRAVCVVTDEGEGIFEIKNIVTSPAFQGRGYGKALIDFVLAHYRGKGRLMIVGTGDSPLTLPFYRRCGFIESHRVKNFFTDHYDHPIFEAGKQLVDMVYLSQALG